VGATDNGAVVSYRDDDTTIDVSVEDDTGAATDDDEDDAELHDDGAVLPDVDNAFDDDEQTAVSEDHRQLDGESLRIDDNDVLQPLSSASKPGDTDLHLSLHCV